MPTSRIPPHGGDQNHSLALLATAVVSSTLAVVTTIIRILGRTLIVRSVGWDDYTIVVATAISVIGVVFNGEQVKNGAGRHEYYLQHHEIVEEVKWHTLAQIQLYICVSLVKTSVCLFLIRIVNKKYLVRLLYTLSAAVIIVNLAVVIALVTECRPLAKVWDVRINGQCWNVDVLKTFAWIAGAFAVVTDFICSLLPSFFLRKVQISPRTKLALCALMGLGLVATAFSILKMALLPVYGATDTTYSQTLIQISAILEENVGIIAVNMPLMRPLYGVLKPKIESRYSQFRHSLAKRLHGNTTDASTEMQSSVQKLGFQGDCEWGLRVPGSQTMKTIDLPMARTYDSDRSESASILLPDKTTRRVFEDRV